MPVTHTSLGRSSFQFAAASDWNELQKTLKLDSFISISSFKDSIMDTLNDNCGCFARCIVISNFLPLCCCLCPIMFVQCFVLLPCCAVAMLCCYHAVLLPCYDVVLGLSLCSIAVSLLSWCLFCPIYIFFILAPSLQEAFCLLVGCHCK